MYTVKNMIIRKYKVTIDGNDVRILNCKNGIIKNYDIREFVYGQIMYNENTDNYPNYVHGTIWDTIRLKMRSWKFRTRNVFFTRKTMKFFGDTMANYGCFSGTVTKDKKEIDVWVLWRKNPVKHGLNSSAYFDKKTFERVFANHE